MVGKTFNISGNNAIQDFNLASVGLVSGNEFIIHNIYFNNAISISVYDGTNLNTYDTDNAGGSRQGMSTHCNINQWLRVTNLYTGNTLVSFDGIQTV